MFFSNCRHGGRRNCILVGMADYFYAPVLPPARKLILPDRLARRQSAAGCEWLQPPRELLRAGTV